MGNQITRLGESQSGRQPNEDVWPAAPDRGGEKLRGVFPTTAEVTKLCYNKYFQQIAPLLFSLSSQPDDAALQLDNVEKFSANDSLGRGERVVFLYY